MIDISIDDILAELETLRQETGWERFTFAPFLTGENLEDAVKKNRGVILTHKQLREELRIHKGLLAIGNTQIVLHIFEPNMPGANDSWTYSDPRYHLCECKIIKDMRVGGRFNRYVPSKSKDGVFSIRPYDRKLHKSQPKREAHLKPCGWCLGELGYSGAERSKAQNNFDLAEFFAKHASKFEKLPRYTAETMPEGYTSDWKEISDRHKQNAGYRCECCEVNLFKYKSLLHTHHRDGNKGNNRPSNLMAVCVLCHQNQPMHSEMREGTASEYRIREMRREQGKPEFCPRCEG
ncbi:MAG: HNH endonuclease [Proteobacteria bacterium]|nr:HNH endonuclease [Pseudomonadota bacterium]